MPEPEHMKPVRAALVVLPTRVLLDAWTKSAEERYQNEDISWLAQRDYPAEFWPSDSLVDRKLPCVLDFPHRGFFAGHGAALLEQYVRCGERVIPLLAVDWEQVAEVCEEQL